MQREPSIHSEFQGQYFIKVNFSNIDFETLVRQQPKIALVDIGVYQKLFKKSLKLFRKYHGVFVCILSRRVLLIRKRYVIDPLFIHCIENPIYKLGGHPIYPRVTPGMLTGFKEATSYIYAVMLYHNFKSFDDSTKRINYDKQTVVSWFETNNISGKRLPTVRRIKRLLGIAHRQMFDKETLVFFAPSKEDSSIVQTATAELTEAFGIKVGEGYGDDKEEVDDSSDDELYIDIKANRVDNSSVTVELNQVQPIDQSNELGIESVTQSDNT